MVLLNVCVESVCRWALWSRDYITMAWNGGHGKFMVECDPRAVTEVISGKQLRCNIVTGTTMWFREFITSLKET